MIPAERRTVDRPVDRADWLNLRAGFFNASAASVLWGRHPYQSPADYAVEKITGQGQTQTRSMVRGVHLEASVADWWAAEQGVMLGQSSVLFIADRVMATVDRLDLTRGRVVEIKTANGYLSEPEQYWLDQCQAIMFCTGGEVMDLVWLDSSMDLKHVEVDADDAFHTELTKRAERFMAAIDMRIVPDWVQSEITARHVAALYPDPHGEVELDDETVALVRWFQQMRDERDDIERSMEQVKSAIAVRLGDHEVGTHDGEVVVTYKAVKDSERVDTARLRAEHPDLVQQYIETRPGGRRFLPTLR